MLRLLLLCMYGILFRGVAYGYRSMHVFVNSNRCKVMIECIFNFLRGFIVYSLQNIICTTLFIRRIYDCFLGIYGCFNCEGLVGSLPICTLCCDCFAAGFSVHVIITLLVSNNNYSRVDFLCIYSLLANNEVAVDRTILAPSTAATFTGM
jgi:hypothetical protein